MNLHHRLGTFVWAVAWAWFLLSFSPNQAHGAVNCAVVRGREVIQIAGIEFPSPDGASFGEAVAWDPAGGLLSSGSVITPSGSVLTLAPQQGLLRLLQSFPTDSERDVVFRPGAYAFSIVQGGNLTVRVDVGAGGADYPPVPTAPVLSSFNQIEPGRNLKIEWELGPGTLLDDVIVITVQDTTSKQWLFSTPWLGEVDSLPGSPGSTLIPGQVFLPNSTVSVRLTAYRVTAGADSGGNGVLSGSASTLAALLIVGSPPPGIDVSSYFVGRGRFFEQKGQSSPVPAGSGGFGFESSAVASAEGRLLSVAIQAGASPKQPLERLADERSWLRAERFDQEPDVMQAYPVGRYQWIFEGLGQGPFELSSLLTDLPWVPPLTILNYSALQITSPSNSLLIEWSLPAGANPRDQIELSVYLAGGIEVWRNLDPFTGEGILTGTATQVTIPTDALDEGYEYEARLRYIRIDSEDTGSLPGSTGRVGQFVETRFPLGSLTAPLIELETPILPPVQVGHYTGFPLSVSGGREPFSWSVVDGALPPGLTLDPSGVIRGTVLAGGNYAPTFQVVDALGTSVRWTLPILAEGSVPPLEIGITTLPPVEDGFFYHCELPRRGGIGPYRWNVLSGRLPEGVELNPEYGLLSGFAMEVGSFPIQLGLEDATGMIRTQSLQFTVPSLTNNPVLTLGATVRPGGGSLRLLPNSQPGQILTIERSFDLRSWVFVQTTNLPADGAIELEQPPGPLAFYRIHRGAETMLARQNTSDPCAGSDNAKNFGEASSLYLSLKDYFRASRSLEQWFKYHLQAQLLDACADDQLLDKVTHDYQSYDKFVNGFLESAIRDGTQEAEVNIQANYRFEAWKLLARAYVNGVNRTQARCVNEYRPWQARRAEVIALQGNQLGLKVASPSTFDPTAIEERFRRAFRFEVYMTKGEIADAQSLFKTKVWSGAATLITRKGNHLQFDMDNGYLYYQEWKFTKKGQKIKPTGNSLTATGDFNAVHLRLIETWPDGDDPCTPINNYWNDPADVQIIFGFEAKDPIEKMDVKTKKGTETVVANNWWKVFSNVHFLEREKIHDQNGAVHDCVKLEKGWTFKGGRNLAEYNNPAPPKGITETTIIKLRHAPESP